MTEKTKLSVSFRVDDGVIDHNNRNFLPKNVDPARTCDNIVYKSENLREKYHELFDNAFEEYNSRKRSNERIADYYEHIKKGKQEKPFYEVVVQFGDAESCGLKSGNWEIAKQMLDEYMGSFEERNKNMKVFNAVGLILRSKINSCIWTRQLRICILISCLFAQIRRAAYPQECR